MIKSDRCLRLTPLPITKCQQERQNQVDVCTALREVLCPQKVHYQSEVGDS